MKQLNKPVIGVLLLSTPRFRSLGEGTEHGFFYERKDQAAKELLSGLDFADVIFPGVVYTREELKEAMGLFCSRRPDMIFAMFLSWSDDFAWIRFLRDMPPVPLLFATITEESASFTDSFTAVSYTHLKYSQKKTNQGTDYCFRCCISKSHKNLRRFKKKLIRQKCNLSRIKEQATAHCRP